MSKLLSDQQAANIAIHHLYQASVKCNVCELLADRAERQERERVLRELLKGLRARYYQLVGDGHPFIAKVDAALAIKEGE